MAERAAATLPVQDRVPQVVIEKRKLPKGMGYPLKSSALVAALSEAGIAIDVHLIFGDGYNFGAVFWPPNPNVPYERLYIRTGSVPGNEVASARLRLEGAILPEFVAWATAILELPWNSPGRREKQDFGRGFSPDAD